VTFSSNIGSFDTLNQRVRCGLRPTSTQMRPPLDGEMPTASAIAARLQWVASGGASCTVFAITYRRVSRGNGGTRDGRVLSRPSPHALVKIALLPAPDGRPGRIRASHDLVGAAAIRRRQHDLGPPSDLARRTSIGEQGLNLLTVSGAKVKADVIPSYASIMAHQIDGGNQLSGDEHWHPALTSVVTRVVAADYRARPKPPRQWISALRKPHPKVVALGPRP
jgi:hypothetical protein